MNRSQQVFLNDILKFDKQDSIDISDLRNSLLERGLSVSEEETVSLFESLKFPSNHSDRVSRVEVYANGHLF
jgi:PIN domain nuclease of toxin-antitoxin system